jgi:Ca2+-binding EF-hand superfamily protein
MIATDKHIIKMVEHDMIEECRSDGESIKERSLMQWFVEQLVSGDEHSTMKTGLEKMIIKDGKPVVTLGDIFDDIDDNRNGVGTVTKEEFISNCLRMNPKIQQEEAERVFHLMDLDDGGSIDRDEFYIIMSGMTFTGQALDGQTKDGKYFREAPPNEELDDQRQTTSRLAVMFETENFQKDVNTSPEQERRVRCKSVVLDEAKVERARSQSFARSKSVNSTAALAAAAAADAEASKPVKAPDAEPNPSTKPHGSELFFAV